MGRRGDRKGTSKPAVVFRKKAGAYKENVVFKMEIRRKEGAVWNA